MKYIITLVSLFIYPLCSLGSIVNISVTGYVIAMPCEIEKNNYLIDFKKIDAQYIINNNASPWVDFSIKLKNCPVNTSEATMTINGTSDPINSDYFINTGTAQNVALNLANTSDKSLIKNGTKIKSSIDSASRGAEVKLSARLKGFGGDAVLGTFISHVEFTLLYN